MQPIDPHILFDDEEEDDREVGYTPESVSYTHLTLPTILAV